MEVRHQTYHRDSQRVIDVLAEAVGPDGDSKE
jgi:hypothetical protein